MFNITMDCQDLGCPVQRLTFSVSGMPRNEAVLFAEGFAKRLGFEYKIAYVIAGFKEGK